VKLPDANVLLNAVDRDAIQHEQAKAWLEASLSGSESVGFAWTNLLAVIRVSTNPSVYDPPLSADQAIDLVQGWLASPPATVIEPARRHLDVLRALLTEAGSAGNLTSDAHLAALAIEHGATLATFDADFHRFSGLKLEYLGAAEG
jgi:uncharacterized protein